MNGASILFVDDERPVLVMMKLLLRSLGYGCDAVENPLEAIEHFRKNPNGYALVITDFEMPEMDGNELARALINIRPDLPVILLTGTPDPILEQEVRRIGVCGYLSKPTERKQLAAAIRGALERRDEEFASPGAGASSLSAG